MNPRERAKALLPIIQAYVDGKTIQLNFESVWKDIDSGDLLEWLSNNYNEPPDKIRVKPEPREWFLAVDKADNDVMAGSLTRFESKRENWEIIHVKEVL